MIMTRTIENQTVEAKVAPVRQTYELAMSVSLMARRYGAGASQFFNCRKLDREGALTAVEILDALSEPPLAGKKRRTFGTKRNSPVRIRYE